jgi:hypothetical protein
MADSIEMKIGEGKWISFTVTRSGVPVPLNSISDLLFVVKRAKKDTEYALKKEEDDFDLSRAADGIVRVNVSAKDSFGLGAGSFFSELGIVFVEDQDVDKSPMIPFVIKQSIIHQEEEEEEP